MIAMDAQTKGMTLQFRRALLREHIDTVGSSPGFQRALDQTEKELRELGLLEPQSQGS